MLYGLGLRQGLWKDFVRNINRNPKQFVVLGIKFTVDLVKITEKTVKKRLGK